MGALARFEQKLEQAISGVFARAFRSAVQPVEIAAALQREVDNNTQILSRNRRLVPNDFRVELSSARPRPAGGLRPTRWRAISPSSSRTTPQEQGYVFPGPISITFEAADDLTTGRFRVASRALASASDGRPAHPATRRSRAVLDINGSRHPLLPPGLVIGRGTDADIRINDPGISRRTSSSRSPTTRRRSAGCGSPFATSARPTACSSTATASPPRGCATAPWSRSGTPRSWSAWSTRPGARRGRPGTGEEPGV